MATPVQDSEKELLLKVLYEEEIPVLYFRNRIGHSLVLKKPAKDVMTFHTEQPIKKLETKDRIELMFEYRGKAFVFNTEVLKIKNDEISCIVPDYFYKDLDRSYSRVSNPDQLEVQFTFMGDRYSLSFPKIAEHEIEDLGDIFQDSDLRNFSKLVEQMTSWIKKHANGHSLVMFKDVLPSGVEERVISETGKTLFLPSTKDGFPQNDPFPRKQLITENVFKRYLESTGIGMAFVGNACARFVRAKAESGVFSDAWVPIVFHEYVVGYIHAWIDVAGKPLFDYQMINTLHQLAKVLAYSLKLNGYFEQGKLKNDFEGKVIDISASGMLFACLHDLFSSLQPESRLTVSIITPERTITTEAVTVRHFKDDSFGYYGCQFEKMEDDDLRYLFEYIYGKPFVEYDKKYFL